MFQKVLIVDDTLEAVQLLSIMVESHGFESVTALNYKKALRIAKEDGPSAALIDLLMPDVDGLELCRRRPGWSSSRPVSFRCRTCYSAHESGGSPDHRCVGRLVAHERPAGGSLNADQSKRRIRSCAGANPANSSPTNSNGPSSQLSP